MAMAAVLTAMVFSCHKTTSTPPTPTTRLVALAENIKKKILLLLIDELDIKAESTPLSVAERATKKQADEYIARLRRDEEAKWAQRAKVKHIQEGVIIHVIFI